MIKFSKISVLSFAAFLNLSLTAQAANCLGPTSIIKVENTKIGPNEYVNFYLTNPIPEIEVTAVSPPFIRGQSDDTINIAGNKWTQVVFRHVEFMCTIQHFFSLPKPIIKQIELNDQSEGLVSYVIGRQNKNFRSQTITNIPGGKILSLKYR